MPTKDKSPKDCTSTSKYKNCPSCRQKIDAKATKCHYCNESLGKHASVQQKVARVIGYAGLITAILSLFYPLREAYYYLHERNEKREALSAYIDSANHFIKFGKDDFALQLLEKALVLQPNSYNLRIKYFIVRARLNLDNASYDEQQETIQELIPDGFWLLNHPSSQKEKPTLMLLLGRLLWNLPYWVDPKQIGTLFEQAHTLTPQDMEVQFYYGLWLVNNGGTEKKGVKLIHETTQREPDNAFYIHTLGEILEEQESYKEAMEAYITAIKLLPKQIVGKKRMASLNARQNLGSLIKKSAKKYVSIHPDRAGGPAYDISGPDFFGLTLEERIAIVSFALNETPNDRWLRVIATRLYLGANDLKKAYDTVQKVLPDYKHYISSEGLEILELYEIILKKGDFNPGQLVEIRSAIEQRRATTQPR